MKQQTCKFIQYKTFIPVLFFCMGNVFAQETQDKLVVTEQAPAASMMIVNQGRFSQLGVGLPKGHQLKNMLEVNGTILAEEILVQAEIADYVFSPTYDLKSIEYVEEYIQRHSHLPGVPSESAILAGGGKISLGDSYRVLLEKIEELTLYTIEQNKRISELEKTIERLTNETAAVASGRSVR
ncbi:MAG: hypothetical protein QNK19_14690 [Xanthomonadales bacterium]|nr:hypothetical protein [Xanthomonadales bacterium]